MKEFIIVGLLALIIAPILSYCDVFHLEKDKPVEATLFKPLNVPHQIIADLGVIGCRSKEALVDMEKYAARNETASMQDLMDERVCVFFAKGRALLTRYDACVSGNPDGNVFVSIPSEMTSEFYMPCSAIK